MSDNWSCVASKTESTNEFLSLPLAVRHSSPPSSGLTPCRLVVKFSSGTVHRQRLNRPLLCPYRARSVQRQEVKASARKEERTGTDQVRCSACLLPSVETGDPIEREGDDTASDFRVYATGKCMVIKRHATYIHTYILQPLSPSFWSALGSKRGKLKLV